MEQRKHTRLNNISMIADLSDGRRFFSGSVQDLSRVGICLSGVPKQLDHRARLISVVLSGDAGNYKMLTRACWSWQEGRTKTIGLEILNPPQDWEQFILQQELTSPATQ